MNAEVGVESHVDDGVTIGCGDDDDLIIGNRARIRAGAIVYGDVIIGDGFVTGHNVLAREHTTIGDEVLLGIETVVDGTTTTGPCVGIQTSVYISTNTRIGGDVFVGPGVVMTNDSYLVRTDAGLAGSRIENHASIGVNATLLPGVIVGEGASVVVGALVVNDVLPCIFAVDVPAVCRDLPEQLRGENRVRR